ncbi:MAG TPA: hypothetical protein VJU82_12905, partial [Acidobacteriaceae bacterium]|nr:hypothetical protein [Acidobacteriaceae bacterium]
MKHSEPAGTSPGYTAPYPAMLSSLLLKETAQLDRRLTPALNLATPRAKQNREALLKLLAEHRAEEEKIRQGGGQKGIDSQR